MKLKPIQLMQTDRCPRQHGHAFSHAAATAHRAQASIIPKGIWVVILLENAEVIKSWLPIMHLNTMARTHFRKRQVLVDKNPM